jgi:hypothetical protein
LAPAALAVAAGGAMIRGRIDGESMANRGRLVVEYEPSTSGPSDEAKKIWQRMLEFSGVKSD